MQLPHALPSLSPREAVTDALYRLVIGLDTGDKSLCDSAWVTTGDGVFDFNGTELVGKDIDVHIFDRVAPLETTHFISNVRVGLEDGADTAVLSAYALAQHYRPGEGTKPDTERLLSGSMYHLDLVADSGESANRVWRIKRLTMKIIWSEGNRAVVSGSS